MKFSNSGELVWAANHMNGTIDDGWEWPVALLGKWDPEVNDEEWPGIFPLPVNTPNVITLNFRTGKDPTFVSWEWSELINGIDEFETWDEGTPQRKQALYNYEKRVNSDTIYRLKLDNPTYSSREGLKWFTVTTAMASGNHQDGTVIWKKRLDQLKEDMEVFFWVDSAGIVKEVVHIDGVEGVGYALVEYTLVSTGAQSQTRMIGGHGEGSPGPF